MSVVMENATVAFTEEGISTVLLSEVTGDVPTLSNTDHNSSASETDSEVETVPLEAVQVDEELTSFGIRILFRNPDSASIEPLNGMYNKNPYQVDHPQHRHLSSTYDVLEVAQTSDDIFFKANFTNAWAAATLWFYYSSEDDQICLHNPSNQYVQITQITQRSDFPKYGKLSRLSPNSAWYHSPFFSIRPTEMYLATVGTWRLYLQGEMLSEFRILPKSPLIHERSDTHTTSSKRQLEAGNDSERKPPQRKRLKVEEATCNQIVRYANQSLVSIKPRESVHIPGSVTDSPYTITHEKTVHSSDLSVVFKGSHSTEHQPELHQVQIVKIVRSVSKKAMTPQQYKHNLIRMAQTFMNEVQYLRVMKHVAIAHLYDYDARHLTLHMEHVEALSLASPEKWLDHQRMFCGNREDAFFILLDVTGALGYVHSLGIIHNDIKPSNILYSPTRGAVVCDFGIASTYSPQNARPSRRRIGGTTHYIPPEFIIDETRRGPAADAWALGITMLYVLNILPIPVNTEEDKKWNLFDIHSRQGGSISQEAARRMRNWLKEVSVAKTKIMSENILDVLTLQLLEDLPEDRRSMAYLHKILLKYQKNHYPDRLRPPYSLPESPPPAFLSDNILEVPRRAPLPTLSRSSLTTLTRSRPWIPAPRAALEAASPKHVLQENRMAMNVNTVTTATLTDHFPSDYTSDLPATADGNMIQTPLASTHLESTQYADMKSTQYTDMMASCSSGSITRSVTIKRSNTDTICRIQNERGLKRQRTS